MKRVAALLTLFALCGAAVWAQNVAEDEITGVEPGSVEFLNYEGPHQVVQSAEEIRGIGSALGLPDAAAGAESSYFGKYRVIRIIGEGEPGKFHADLFIITEDATVDHIDNVRRVIAGYLEATYEYEAEKAATIAEFLTYYNAVYRGDMEYLREKYKSAVIERLDPEKVGLATVYRDWPGKTQMLIPLRDTAEGPEPSADEAGGEEVVERVREEEEDRGVEQRRDMVEVREEQLAEDEEELEERKEELAEEEAAIEEEEEEIAREEEEIERQREAGAPEEETEAAEEELTQRREAVEQQRQEAEEEQQDIARAEQEQEERREDIQEEREQIAEDQQEMIEEEQERERQAAPPQTVPFVIFQESGGDLLGTIVKANAETGEILERSEVNVIRSREMLLLDDRMVVIAGVDEPPRTVRLTAVDGESLEVVGESDTDIYPGSDLQQRGGDLYAVVRRDGNWYLGRFTAELELRSSSERQVAPFTAISFDGELVYVQSSRREVLRLDRRSLRPPE
jgi:hypothetical protein